MWSGEIDPLGVVFVIILCGVWFLVWRFGPRNKLPGKVTEHERESVGDSDG